MSAIDRLPPPALPFGPASFNDHALVMSQGRARAFTVQSEHLILTISHFVNTACLLWQMLGLDFSTSTDTAAERTIH